MNTIKAFSDRIVYNLLGNTIVMIQKALKYNGILVFRINPKGF